MAPYPESQYVPAKPFADWIEQRVRHYDRTQPETPANQRVSVAAVAEELGWAGENGIRKLYRYRHMLKSVKASGRRGPSSEVHTDRFPRPVVEDALFMAGADFYEVYPQFAHEQDVPLEPAAWCPGCQDHVTPIEGECPWCDWRISDGHLNLGLAA